VTRTAKILDELTTRHEELSSRLGVLKADYDRIAQELSEVETSRQQALRAGEDTDALSEQRRDLEATLHYKGRDVAEVSTWVADLESQLRQKQPHYVLDLDLQRHAAEVAQFHELLGTVDGSHKRALDLVVQAASDLHGLLGGVRQRSDVLNQQAAQLRAEINRLERTDAPPEAVEWESTVAAPLRGTGDLWKIHLTAIQRPAPALAEALGSTASQALSRRR
jgi:chromosome segregation ATPase